MNRFKFKLIFMNPLSCITFVSQFLLLFIFSIIVLIYFILFLLNLNVFNKLQLHYI